MKHQKSEQKPELKKTGGKRRVRRNSDDFRRKTRSQALSEKQKALSLSLEFSDVSIETLHSICAPAVLQQAKKNLQKQQPNKSSSRSTDQHKKFYGLPSQAHSPQEHQLQAESHSKEVVTKKSPHSSNVADNVPLEDTWLEVFVEIDDGIDLVVDLDSNSIADWFLERNSSMFVHPDAADESQKQCGTDLHANEHPEVACFGSSTSTNTTTHNDKLTIFCVAADGDAGSQTAQMGIIAGCKIAEVMDSQESFDSEVRDPRNQGFNFGSLERMPTFFATGMGKPSAEESKVTCISNYMVPCIGA